MSRGHILSLGRCPPRWSPRGEKETRREQEEQIKRGEKMQFYLFLLLLSSLGQTDLVVCLSGTPSYFVERVRHLILYSRVSEVVSVVHILFEWRRFWFSNWGYFIDRKCDWLITRRERRTESEEVGEAVGEDQRRKKCATVEESWKFIVWNEEDNFQREYSKR